MITERMNYKSESFDEIAQQHTRDHILSGYELKFFLD